MAKSYGSTINAYLDGTGNGDSSLYYECSLEMYDLSHKCPYALAPIMPMQPTDPCVYNQGGVCTCPAAKLAHLKLLEKMIKTEAKEIQEMLDNY